MRLQTKLKVFKSVDTIEAEPLNIYLNSSFTILNENVFCFESFILFGVDILLRLTAATVSFLFLFLDYIETIWLCARFHFESLFCLFCYPFFIVCVYYFSVCFLFFFFLREEKTNLSHRFQRLHLPAIFPYLAFFFFCIVHVH